MIVRALFPFSILFLFLVSGCVFPGHDSPASTPAVSPQPLTSEQKREGQTVSFSSEDGVTLVGTLWKNPDSARPPVVLVHQLSRDRHSWDDFAKMLFSHGYTVLSFDLRGHGDSTKQGTKTLSFVNFTEGQYSLMTSDIWSAKKFLNVEKILVVGASIGANASLVYASEDISSPGIVLLSPGTNFHGIDITTASKQKRVPMLVIASKEDTYSASSAQSLFTSGPLLDKKLLMLEDAGHGTDMLLGWPDLGATILEWLNTHSGV